jgi:hypothetical protein
VLVELVEEELVGDMGVSLNGHENYCALWKGAQSCTCNISRNAPIEMASLRDLRQKLDLVLGKLYGLEAEFTADFAKLYNGHGLALQKLGDLIDAWNELMKLRPQPKRGKRRGGKRAGER